MKVKFPIVRIDIAVFLLRRAFLCYQNTSVECVISSARDVRDQFLGA